MNRRHIIHGRRNGRLPLGLSAAVILAFVAPAGAQTASPAKVGTFNPTQASFLLDANGNLTWDGGPPDMCFPWGSAYHSPPYKPVVGDWNGSGTKKIGIFDPGNATWLLDYNGDGVFTPGVDKQFQWGQADDTPVVGDWNGSGTTKIGTWNPSSMTFTLDYNGNFSYDGPIVDRYVTWGQHTTDLPVVGDWNGTGTMKIGTFDPTAALWTLDFNGDYAFEPTVDKLFPWGSTVDRPVVGDWNGSGATKVGVVTANDEVWLLDYNGNFSWDGPVIDKCVPWGSARDAPVIGDWNSSSTMKAGTLGPTTALWLLDYNGNFIWDGAAVDKYFAWGAAGDVPVVGNWGPLEPVTVTASQPGVALTIDGTVYSSPQVFQWPAGSAHTIGVSSPQSVGGTQYTFTNWSDGLPQTHTVTIPSTSANYTAYFATPPLTITTASPLPGGILSEPYNSTVFSGFAATGGTAPYTWTVYTPDLLPTGLTLSSNGTFSTGTYGRLIRAGTFTFWVKATDHSGQFTTGLFSLTISVPTLLSDLKAFQDCIGGSGFQNPDTGSGDTMGYGMTCALAPRTSAYFVSSPLVIGRSGYACPGDSRCQPGDSSNHPLLITGTEVGGVFDTVLRRANPLAGPATTDPIMTAQTASVTNVVIQSLAFDGNRYGWRASNPGSSLDISCIYSPHTAYPYDASYVPQWFDLDLHAGGIFTVQDAEFINAPHTALVLGGNGTSTQASTVWLSSFGMGIGTKNPDGSCPPGPQSWPSSIGPDGNETWCLEPTQTATRSTAVYLTDSYTKAELNAIQNAGTAGISLEGTNQVAYYNQLTHNRFEISDGIGGGQLTIWRGFIRHQLAPASALVTSNTIDGQNWVRPAGDGLEPSTGCEYVPSIYPDCETCQPTAHWDQQPPSGVESNGYGHAFYDNEIVNNTGGGMAFNLDTPQTPTGRITIGGLNPTSPSDTLRYIEANGYNGVTFRYDDKAGLVNGVDRGSVDGVTLDAIFTRKNAGYGVAFNNVLDNASYTGFINGSCMADNGATPPPPPPAGQLCIVGTTPVNDANVQCWSKYNPTQPSNPSPRDSTGKLAQQPGSLAYNQYYNPGAGTWNACPGTSWLVPAVPTYYVPLWLIR
jgi:hypothetical protein